MLKSKCCGAEAIKIRRLGFIEKQYFCSGVYGCGNYCEAIDDDEIIAARKYRDIIFKGIKGGAYTNEDVQFLLTVNQDLKI